MLLGLPKPEVLEITGVDALAFAQAQFCNDVNLLKTGSWQWNAWLNPQGRVRWFFHLLRLDEQRLMAILRGGLANEFHTALQPYVFRAKLSLVSQNHWHASGAINDQAVVEVATALFNQVPLENALTENENAIGLRLSGPTQRLLLLGRSSINGRFDIVCEKNAVEPWRTQDILAGLVEIDSVTTTQFLPQMLGFERIDAISFRKGCYPGQEVVARVHFKGGNKRSLYRIESNAGAVSVGTSLQTAIAPHEPAGTVLNSAVGKNGLAICLAVLRDDLAAAALRFAAAPEVTLKINAIK